MSRMTVSHKLAYKGKKSFLGKKKVEMENLTKPETILKDSY